MSRTPDAETAPVDPPLDDANRREPPSWVVPAAIAALPLTLGFLVVAGLAKSDSAVIALMVGTFALVLLVGWWMVPPTARGLAVVALASTLASIAAGVTYTVLQRWVEDPQAVAVNRRSPDPAGAALIGADLRGADLSNVVLTESNLGEATAIGANLVGADLRRSDLRGIDLTRANLSQACLQDADLRDATIVDTNFTGADLRGANINGVDPSLLPSEADQELSTAC